MKKIAQAIVFIIVIISFSYCSKDEETTIETVKESIDKKWIVENSTEFQSIEFDSNGNYIIIKNSGNTISKNAKKAEDIFVTGTYEILDTDILLLSNFGSMKFDDSDPANVKFSIKYEGSDTYTYELKVTKAAEFTSTLKTDLLCDNTWKFTKKAPIKDTVTLINFSKAGTCFTNFSITSQNAGHYIEFGKWEWFDNTETKIVITQIKSPEWMLDKDGEAEFEITGISKVKLELKEVFKNESYAIAFDTINAGKK